MQEYTLANVPTVDEYVAGLTAIADRISDTQRRLLESQYSAVNRTVTSPQLATLAHVSGGHSIVNSQYGRLGHLFCDQTGLEPDLRPDDTHRWWSVWSSGYSHPDGFRWVMNPQVASALERLGWVDPSTASTNIPEPSDIAAPAADRVTCTTVRIVRDTTLARMLKEFHNHTCQVCGMTIELPNGQRYAEAHHIKPLGSPHDGPDVAENIIVLCPNHHAMCDFGALELNVADLTMRPEHEIGGEYLRYHNEVIIPQAAK